MELSPFQWGTEKGLELSVGITVWREKLTFQDPLLCNHGEEHPVSGVHSHLMRLQGALLPLRFCFSDLVILPLVSVWRFYPTVLIYTLLYNFYPLKSQFVLYVMVWGRFLLHLSEPSAKNRLFPYSFSLIFLALAVAVAQSSETEFLSCLGLTPCGLRRRWGESMDMLLSNTLCSSCCFWSKFA